MNKTFNEKYERGVLSRELFLSSDVTQNFILWLVDFVRGDRNLGIYRYRNASMIDAFNDYQWRRAGKDENFDQTFQRFLGYRDVFKQSTDEEWRAICLKILHWGGVENHNKAKIENRKEIKELFNTQIQITQQEEIVIDDLNPNYINSGYSKIYSAIDPNFIMYDSRVGSALCNLIRNYLIETEQNSLPVELIFGFGLGKGKKKRNPNVGDMDFKFPEFTHNKTIHFVSNIKANWLLKNIAEQVDIVGCETIEKKMFALQSALFMLGEEMPE